MQEMSKLFRQMMGVAYLTDPTQSYEQTFYHWNLLVVEAEGIFTQGELSILEGKIHEKVAKRTKFQTPSVKLSSLNSTASETNVLKRAWNAYTNLQISSNMKIYCGGGVDKRFGLPIALALPFSFIHGCIF